MKTTEHTPATEQTNEVNQQDNGTSKRDQNETTASQPKASTDYTDEYDNYCPWEL